MIYQLKNLYQVYLTMKIFNIHLEKLILILILKKKILKIN